MRRLYLQVYLAFVGILVLFAVLVSIAWLLFHPTPEERQTMEGMGRLLGQILPGPESSPRELQEDLDRLGGVFPLDLTVRSPRGELLAAHGPALPEPASARPESGWMRVRGRGPVAVFRLPDGRWLSATYRRSARRHAFPGLVTLGLLAFAIAVGAYPLARRITSRVERLQQRVDALGAGDLSVRVEVEGSDEVASLARSFNRAAERIEKLVEAQRSRLLSASHELRTPLARLRVALELLSEGARPDLRERVGRDIAELDELIDEILLASRLDALEGPERAEAVDLLALAAEEAARSGAGVDGEPATVSGDPRLLRRLVRNLLDNARRHGRGAPVEALVEPQGQGRARLRVCDRGPGVPEEERERIFEPFYRRAGDAEERGFGLGLALVRQIARHHGGDVRCLPRDGGGTCFEVEL